MALALAVAHPEVVSQLVLYEPPLHLKKHMNLSVAPRFVKTLLLGAIRRKRAAAAVAACAVS